MQTKIVFYGCAMSGKTTALIRLNNQLNGGKPIVSIDTSHEKNKRTLFYDYGILDLNFGIWKLKLNLWTATGQDFYCATRTTVLWGADGIIFIADSRNNLIEENIKSWNELKSFFKDKLEKVIPVVICLNKRDLSDIISIESFRKFLNLQLATQLFETIAIQNHNLYSAFKALFENIFYVHKMAKSAIMSQLRDYPWKDNQ